MKACPGCSFLIIDDEELCAHCEAEQLRAAQLRDASQVEQAIVLPAGTTALLSPPRVAALPDSVKYRAPRRTFNPKFILLLIPVALVVVAALGLTGSGPLASQFISRGWVERPTVIFSPGWAPVSDVSRSFEATMPVGTVDVFRPLDPSTPDSGGLVGERVEGQLGGSTEVVWTNFAMSPEAISAYDSPTGVRDLAVRFIAAQKMTGQQTVVRDAVVPEGVAVDTVLVNGTIGASEDALTSRARFVLADNRFYAIITTGPDSESRELDAAHRQVVASFDPEA